MWKWDWIIRSGKMKKQGAEISCVILWLPLPCCPCSCQCQIQKSPSTVLEELSWGLRSSIAVKAAAGGQCGQRQWSGWRAGAQPHAEEPFWAASCRRCSPLITIIRTSQSSPCCSYRNCSAAASLHALFNPLLQNTVNPQKVIRKPPLITSLTCTMASQTTSGLQMTDGEQPQEGMQQLSIWSATVARERSSL